MEIIQPDFEPVLQFLRSKRGLFSGIHGESENHTGRTGQRKKVQGRRRQLSASRAFSVLQRAFWGQNEDIADKGDILYYSKMSYVKGCPLYSHYTREPNLRLLILNPLFLLIFFQIYLQIPHSFQNYSILFHSTDLVKWSRS